MFGVLDSDSIFYTPVLGFFAFTGIPTSVSSLSLSPNLMYGVVSLVEQVEWGLYVGRYSYGSNQLKLLIRKLRNKIKEMDIVKTLCN